MTKVKRPGAKRGRPPVDPGRRTIAVSIALPREEADALRDLADRRGVSFSSLVSGVLRAWLARQGR